MPRTLRALLLAAALAGAAAAQPAPKDPVPAAADPATARKADAWIEAQNALVGARRDFRAEVAQFRSENAAVLRPNARPGPNATLGFRVLGVSTTIGNLRRAAALPGAVPGVDEAGQALLRSAEAFEATVTELRRYADTRAFRDDGFDLARARAPDLAAAAADLADRLAQFSKATSDWQEASDRRLIEALPEGSPLRRTLEADLQARRVVHLGQGLRPRADARDFAAAVSGLAAVNRAMQDGFGAAAAAAADDPCARYGQALDLLVGRGRDLAQSARTGDGFGQAMSWLVRDYNHTLSPLRICRDRLVQARR